MRDASRVSRWLSCLWRLAVLASLLLAGSSKAAHEILPPPQWRIVLLRSWDSADMARESALRRAILADAPRRVDFYPEDIELQGLPESLEPQLVERLRQKYQGTPIDLVVASGNNPLRFLERHRDAIWPGATIVFNGVVAGTLDGWTRPGRTTGVMETLDIEGTVALGRALRPEARALHVVSGSASFDRFILDVAMKRLATTAPPLEVRYLAGLSSAQLVERVAGLGPDAIVLFLTMVRDAEGHLSGPDGQTVQQVAAHSAAPVLSAIQTQFEHGPVGGSSPRYEEHGRIAGRLARLVLEGADPDAIPLSAQPAATCEVDWKALRRWSIPERNVPQQCAMVNRPPEFWRANLWPLLAMVAIILVQSALLWALFLQRRERYRAEAELRVRGAEMVEVARLSTVGALTASIAHEINQPMGAILSNTEAAQMMLRDGTLQPALLQDILEDIRSEDLRASEVIRRLRKLLGRVEWKPLPIELNTEVAEALRHVAFEAARRNVKVVPVFDGTVPAVLGDPVQVQQVVINLVVNAMEAVVTSSTADREVRVVTQSDRGGAEIVISDRGPGIAPEDRGRLFHSHFTRKQGGMGFGLSIVRAIVETHRGTVSFEPNVPHGAVFRVTFPAIGT